MVLVVGPELVPFDADKNLICGSSPFFEAAFNGRFKESSGLIELEEDDVDVFEHFMQWLHSREIDIAQVSDRKRRFTHLSRLYVFADKYGIVRLKNHVMTMLFDTIKHPEGTYRTGEPGSHCIRIETLDYVYYNTVRGSLLRKFIAAICVWCFSLENLEREDLWTHLLSCPELAMDLGINLAQRANNWSDPLVDIKSFLERVPKGKV